MITLFLLFVLLPCSFLFFFLLLFFLCYFLHYFFITFYLVFYSSFLLSFIFSFILLFSFLKTFSLPHYLSTLPPPPFSSLNFFFLTTILPSFQSPFLLLSFLPPSLYFFLSSFKPPSLLNLPHASSFPPTPFLPSNPLFSKFKSFKN